MTMIFLFFIHIISINIFTYASKLQQHEILSDQLIERDGTTQNSCIPLANDLTPKFCSSFQNGLSFFQTTEEICQYFEIAVISLQYCLYSIQYFQDTANTISVYSNLLNKIQACSISTTHSLSTCDSIPTYNLPSLSTQDESCLSPFNTPSRCLNYCLNAIPDIVQTGSIDETKNKDFCSIYLCFKCASSYSWIQQMLVDDLAEYFPEEVLSSSITSQLSEKTNTLSK